MTFLQFIDIEKSLGLSFNMEAKMLNAGGKKKKREGWWCHNILSAKEFCKTEVSKSPLGCVILLFESLMLP